MSASAKLPRFPGVKDPDDRVAITFRGGDVPEGVTVTSVTVTEVDDADVPVVPSAFTLGLVVVTFDVFWKATCSVDGGVANPVVTPGVRPDPKRYLLRSRWFLSNGATRDKTLELYVGNN